MYMDGIKLFAKNEKELETLIQVVRIYSQDIGMESAIEKCARLIMRNRDRQMMEGIKLPNEDKIRTLREKETYKYLWISEADSIKQVKIKKKLKKNTSRGRENYSKPIYITKMSSKG